ncbi:hypothetical protein GCM10009864_48400 [Streptomyces lunalinharesii]|uniref:Uncharacterized protein n=1 Tax=Streptomyces lunalinharesii TaxID=333384 RepID=A0ABN3SAK5_9ACTN
MAAGRWPVPGFATALGVPAPAGAGATASGACASASSAAVTGPALSLLPAAVPEDPFAQPLTTSRDVTVSAGKTAYLMDLRTVGSSGAWRGAAEGRKHSGRAVTRR